MVARHPKDKRRITAQRLPASEKRAKALGLQVRRARIELAKELARIDQAAAFVFHGCASIGEYGVQIEHSRLSVLPIWVASCARPARSKMPTTGSRAH